MCIILFAKSPGCTSGKEPADQCRRHKRRGFDPWIRTIPWRMAWQPTPVFLPGESHRQRSPVGYSPQGRKELNMTGVTWYAHTYIFILYMGVTTCIPVADSYWCMAKTITILQSNYPAIKINKLIKKQRIFLFYWEHTHILSCCLTNSRWPLDGKKKGKTIQSSFIYLNSDLTFGKSEG